MRVTFFGTRGSAPVSLRACDVRDKIKRAFVLAGNRELCGSQALDHFIDGELPFAVRGSYGGNTSCVRVGDGPESIVCDAGTGLQDLSNEVMALPPEQRPREYHILLSHLHWDHIQGFPFFIPAYIPGNTIMLYGCGGELEQAFANQQAPMHFPVPLRSMAASIRFRRLELHTSHTIAGFTVRGLEQYHPGKSYGYRIEKDGITVVYSTDSEHQHDATQSDTAFINFFRDADLLIMDSQYSLVDAVVTKENWGHGSNIIAVELAVESGVRHLALFHSDPNQDDAKLDDVLKNTNKYLERYAPGSRLGITLAYDGLEIEV